MEKKCQRSFSGRNREICRACRNLAKKYKVILGRVKDKFVMKKAEILLQEVTANIGLLTESKEGGFMVDDELKRL
ncbi:hypothetical protein Bca4012_065644 [Brassica carinata]